MDLTSTLTVRRVVSGLGRLLEHTVAVVLGFAMMVVGLAMGVTMVMLPVGVVVGLLGVALFIGGMFERLDETKH
jgi:hypothetical protein